MSEEVPVIVGGHGLTGRPLVPRPQDDPILPVGEDENGRPVFAEEPAPGPTIPPSCLRLLVAPLRPDGSPRHTCDGYCPGRQPGGGCLVDIVRRAQAQGVEWRFDVIAHEDGRGEWRYAGDPLKT